MLLTLFIYLGLRLGLWLSFGVGVRVRVMVRGCTRPKTVGRVRVRVGVMVRGCTRPKTVGRVYSIVQFNFTNRVIPVWNSLPNRVVSADTINTYNKKLSYCCDSRSYCVQKYDRLKQLLLDTLSILMPSLLYIHCDRSFSTCE